MHKLPAGQLCVGGTNKAISASSFIAFIYLINLSSRDKLYSIHASQLTSANAETSSWPALCWWLKQGDSGKFVYRFCYPCYLYRERQVV